MSSGGQGANAESAAPVLSADGRFVAFESAATNLVPGDGKKRKDIFVHDRLTGETSRVSISSTDQQGNGNSIAPAISGDGQIVVFESQATNLVAGDIEKRKRHIFGP